jgi:ATP-dependent Clp protease protease subunit
MKYARTQLLKTTEGAHEVLVPDDCLVTPREHLASKRIINVVGELGMELESSNLLLSMDSQNQAPIILLISSPGGLVDAAFLIYDIMKLVQSPVYTVGTYCCSAAVMLLAAGTPGRRYLLPHSKIMIHLPQTRFSGDPKDMNIAQKEMESYQNSMIKIYQDCGVKKTRKQILRDIDREYWMTAQEAIDYGLADEVVSKEEVQRWLK